MKTNEMNINEMLPTDNVNSSTTTSTTPQSTSGSKNNPTINIKKKDVSSDPNLIKNLAKSGKVNINVIEEADILEPEAVITPQDNATIKYLSNVRDSKTGEISKPFTIGAQKYQMVRGMCDNQVVMAVFSHDETDDNGENIIYPTDIFEKTIIQPMMEKEIMGQEKPMFGNDIEEKVKPEPKGMESLNLSDFKHYLVNEKNGKFRKFKNIVELAAAVMAEDEKYMPIKEFRKFFENRVFGGKKEPEMNIMEVAPTGEESDEEMNQKAQKLMMMISKRIPSNVIETIKTPVAKREVIAAFAELIGVPRQGLPGLINGLKDLAKSKPTAGSPAAGTAPAAPGSTPLPPDNQLAPVTEKKVITKAALDESLLKPKVIKTIKVKDIK